MRFAIFLLAAMFPFCLTAETVVRIVGSDLLKPVIEAALRDHKAIDAQSVKLELKGTLPGVDQWQAGNAELLVEAILPGKPVPHDAVPLGYAVAIVLVHKNNPILELSLPQLASIYGQGSDASVQRWSEVGAIGSFGNRTISPAIVESRQAILVDQFRDQVLSNSQLRSSVRRLSDQAEIALIFNGDLGAIVVTDRLPAADSQAKAMPLSLGGENHFAFGPTEQNIHYGEYPLRVGFYLRFNAENRDAVKAIVALLLGNSSAERLTSAGFIPVPEVQRKRLLQELDK